MVVEMRGYYMYSVHPCIHQSRIEYQLKVTSSKSNANPSTVVSNTYGRKSNRLDQCYLSQIARIGCLYLFLWFPDRPGIHGLTSFLQGQGNNRADEIDTPCILRTEYISTVYCAFLFIQVLFYVDRGDAAPTRPAKAQTRPVCMLSCCIYIHTQEQDTQIVWTYITWSKKKWGQILHRTRKQHSRSSHPEPVFLVVAVGVGDQVGSNGIIMVHMDIGTRC